MSEQKPNVPTLPTDWADILRPHFESESYQKLRAFLDSRFKEGALIFPPKSSIFRAFKEVSFADTKVVILGQDPYHGARQANGFAFGVQSNLPRPPALRNIFTEIETNFNIKLPRHQSSLQGWAAQGVLLLNTVLTVEEGRPGSHANKGWEDLTDFAIKELSDKKPHLVFLLWGRHARNKASLIDRRKHAILECPHPSPLSANTGFFGCGHFSQTNWYLHSWKYDRIDWSRIDLVKETRPSDITDLLGV